MAKTRYNPAIHHRRSIRLRGYDYTRAGAYFVTLCVQDRRCVLGEIRRGAMVFSEWGRIVAQTWTWLRDQYPYVALDVWVVMPNHFHGIIVLTDDVRGVGASVARVGASIADVGASIARVGAYPDVGAFVEARVGASSADVGALVVDVGASSADVGASVADVGASVADVEASVADVGASFADVGASFADVGASFADVEASVADVEASFADVGALVADVGASFADVGASFARVGARRDAPQRAPQRAPQPDTPQPDAPPIKRKPLGQLIGAFKTVSTKHINAMLGTPGARFWQRDYYEHIVRDERDLARIRRYIINNPRRWQEDRDNLTNIRRLPPPSVVEDYLKDMEGYAEDGEER